MKLKLLAFTLILCLILSACGNVAGVSVPAQNTETAVKTAEEGAASGSAVDYPAKPDDTTGDAVTGASTATEGAITSEGAIAAEPAAEPEPIWYEPAPVKSEGTPTGIVYLTFDDGPCGYTDDVLAVLDKYGVKATFFLTASHPSMFRYIKDIADAGHGIGVHSYTHEYYQCYASEEAFYEECEKMNDVIEEYTGYRTNILRFPGGSSNTVSAKYVKGLMTTLAAGVEERGYTYFDWNVSSGDASSNTSVNSIISNTEKGIKKNRESVVLMHDFKKNTLQALPHIIEWCLENGYELRPLTADGPTCHQKINN
jgi:peptidoglycan/xylan/chitin deacetylase (PgdA/CDA1 family)